MNNAGTQNYYIGIKDSDSSKLYLGRGRDPSQGVAPAITEDTSDNVGIGTSFPTQKVDVSDTVKATAFIGDGSQLTGLPGGGNSALDKVATDTTISNTAAETSLYSFSVPANTLGTNNRLRLVIHGEYRRTVCDECESSFVFRLKYGGTTLFATPPIFPPDTFLGLFIAEMLLSADGATNSQLGTLWGSQGTAAVNSTAAQTLQITVDWDNANVNHIVRLKHAVLEVVQ